ncbi:MAG TPA: tetratricopeptide repeat protein [Thermoanaerobaculia bacterium]|jgi:tetratricopeptide (TPR) repeat protein|nr:tetratricopeptide repeat protein [Thermoanaerobaculia bacterium]
MSPIRARAVFLLASGLSLAATASGAAPPPDPTPPVTSTNPANPADIAGEPTGAETPPPGVRVLRTGGLRVETAALLWSGQQGGPVAIAAQALPLPGRGPAAQDKVRIAVVIEAAGAALSKAAANSETELSYLPVDVAIYALDERGALAGSVIETAEIPDPIQSLLTHGFRFVAGLALRPGTYSLRILVGHSGSRTFGLRTLPLNVPAAVDVAPLPETPASGDGWLTVASLDAQALGLPTGLEVDPAEREKMIPGGDAAPLAGVKTDEADAPGHWRRSEAAALRATYARILARLGAGDEAKAGEEIAAFEVPLLSGPKAATREELTALEGEVLRNLERRNPESLVPVMALYRTLHGVYQKRNLRQPAMHAVILVGSLAELYARAVPSPEGRRLAAGFLVSLTPNLDRSGLSTMVEAEFKRALELDPDHPQALLGHAQDDERHGRYAEAVAGLERLDAQSPHDAEVLVRLAVNVSRLGRIKRARELFLKIVAPLRAAETSKPDADAWPLALAAQELARLEIAAKDRPAAGRVLALGLASFPDDEKLALLSAALGELPSTDRTEAASAKERIAQWNPLAGSGISPRLRYDQLPRRRIEALWQNLERAGKDRLPALAAALGPDGKVKGAP